MARRAKFTKTEVKLALENADGVVAGAMTALGVAHSTMYRYINNYKLWSVVQVERDELVKLAKTGLSYHLRKEEPEPWAIKYTLSTMSDEFSGGLKPIKLYGRVSPDDWDDDDAD